MSKVDLLEKVRKVIDEVLGEYISGDPAERRRIIEEATFLGKDDPGSWSQTAAVVIHCESGIPSGMYHVPVFEKWFDVSDKLKTHFCEHINSAVIGVYEV